MKLPFLTTGTVPALPIWPIGTSEPIKVLLIDDDDDEASLTRSLLARVEDIQYSLDWVPTFGEGLASIAQHEHDAYLIDQRLGARSGIELVREARQAGSLAALIVMTGQRDRTTDLAAMIAGATDFLLKGKTDAALLDRTLRYAITQAAAVSALERSRNQMAGLEELGRILVAEGPTPATIGRVVDLIVDRFLCAPGRDLSRRRRHPAPRRTAGILAPAAERQPRRHRRGAGCAGGPAGLRSDSQPRAGRPQRRQHADDRAVGPAARERRAGRAPERRVIGRRAHRRSRLFGHPPGRRTPDRCPRGGARAPGR